MKHVNWASSDSEVRLQLVKSAYDAHVLLIYRSAKSYRAIRQSLEVGKYQAGLFRVIVNVCEEYGFDGVEYVRAQFYFRWKSEGTPLVPPVGVMDGKRAIRNFQKWLDAQPSNPAYTPKQKYERAMRQSQFLVESFIRVNSKEYPDVKAVLREPGIRKMLAECYLAQSPAMQELIREDQVKSLQTTVTSAFAALQAAKD